jgi:hypothetical protein
MLINVNIGTLFHQSPDGNNLNIETSDSKARPPVFRIAEKISAPGSIGQMLLKIF